MFLNSKLRSILFSKLSNVSLFSIFLVLLRRLAFSFVFRQKAGGDEAVAK